MKESNIMGWVTLRCITAEVVQALTMDALTPLEIAERASVIIAQAADILKGALAEEEADREDARLDAKFEER